MFESLADKLQTAFARLRTRGRLSEDDVTEALREVRLALLEADVHFKVVKDLVARIRTRAIGVDVLESLSPVQMVVKIVNEELTELLGGDSVRLHFAPKPPTVIMLCGLQGSGKTTTCAKLAHWARRQGHQPMMAACDIYRPAAIKQLQVLGEQLKVPVFTLGDQVSAPTIASQAITWASENGCDVVILDTAGRLHIDAAMMGELRAVADTVNPTEKLLVVDSMAGQDAVNFAREFHEQLQIDGFVLTKMDGDARGGAALSIRSVAGAPIKFVGMGEKLDMLESFHPGRTASRILGMGDVLSLIEKAEQAIDEKTAREMERRLRENKFDLNDYLGQLQQMKKLGPLDQILGMIPGMGKMKTTEADEARLRRTEALVHSMTLHERSDPRLLNAGRKRRIAAGSGTTVQELNEFLKQFDQMRTMVRQMTGGMKAMKKQKSRGRMGF